MDDSWSARLHALGGVIRTQRKLAQLSLRELAALTNLSNAYLSQVERGLHEPSVRVLTSISRALNVPAEGLLQQAGLLEDGARAGTPATESAIRSDPVLSESQKEALLAVYRSYVAAHEGD